MAAPHCPGRLALCLRVIAVALALVIAPHSSSPRSRLRAKGRRRPAEVRALWVTRATLASPAAIAQMVQRRAERRLQHAHRAGARPRRRVLHAARSSHAPAELGVAARTSIRWPKRSRVARTRRPARARLGRRQSGVERGRAAGVAATHHLSPAGLADGAARAGGGDARDSIRAARSMSAGWRAGRARVRTRSKGCTRRRSIRASSTHVVADVVDELVDAATRSTACTSTTRAIPSEDFDYSRAALQQFKLAVRPELSEADRAARRQPRGDRSARLPGSVSASAGQSFRRSRLTSIVMRLRTAVKAARPAAMLSAAVVPDLAQALRFALPGLAHVARSVADRRPVPDGVHARIVAVFERQIVRRAAIWPASAPVWAGIGAYRLSCRGHRSQHIAAARRLQTPRASSCFRTTR